MTDPTHSPVFDAAAEFDRQVRTLVSLGYPALSGRAPDRFAELVAPLRRGRGPHGLRGVRRTEPAVRRRIPSSWSSDANSPRSNGPCR
ncbi:putative protein OS=Streptomyces tendae OX=1932 GN=GUR47_27180 PE=4 SV=1 [Streptomyces tendae]